MTATKKRAGSGAVQELPLDSAPVVETGSAIMKPEQAAGNGNALRTAPDGSAASVYQLMQQAIEKGTDVATIEKLVDLAERVTKREAALEFNRSLADFQAACPPIGKNRTAEITTKSGGKYSYQYAPLDEIVRIVKPLLMARGFSYGWDSRVEGEGQNQRLVCTCTLRHVNGHSETSSFTLPTDNPSAMSPQQKYGAALTFAQRYTLVSALGLNTTEEDSDGVAREIDPTPISEDQLDELENLIEDIGVNRVRFLKYLAVEKLGELPAARFAEAKAALLEKRNARGAK